MSDDASDPGRGLGATLIVLIVLIVLLVAAALVALVVAIAREGPDRTLTGTVTERESHRVCVDRPPGPDLCVRSDAPERLAGISVGDCVRVRSSPEGLLISIDRMVAGCR